MREEEYSAMFELEERLWWYEGMRAITASILDAALEKKESIRLLDVGCGTGYSLKWLSHHLNTDAAFGIDASPHAAEFWRLRGISNSVIASSINLPFASSEFDLVTCFDVIYQFPATEAKAAMLEVSRVLKPGGFLFIREPAYRWLRGAHDVAVGTRHRYTLAQMRRLLRSSGFAPRRASYANTLLFGAAVPHRLLSRLKGETGSDVRPVPAWMNKIFLAALRFEARLLDHFTFPFGLSVIALAEKERI